MGKILLAHIRFSTELKTGKVPSLMMTNMSNY